MTLKELSQLYYLQKEIRMYENKIKELRTQAEGITKPLTGMPGGGGNHDRMGSAIEKIDLYEHKINALRERCITELMSLSAYISAIDDSLTRQIFMLRFVDGLQWEDVAERTGSSEYAVKHICYRYIKQK